MATIKPIDGGTIHRIQSGQVIIDLCSVAKELIENSVDAGATSIEIRFKNQGLDCIEVQDNGSGISPENYPSVALKHYTSKLSSYSDISNLQTFGFRGEALSSLSALSHLAVVTCLAGDAPKGTRLEFSSSGALNNTSVVSARQGTTVIVEKLFHNLPVRRRELERHIKREWTKVLSLLNQYACILMGVKFTVSQQPNKGKRVVQFATRGNPSVRENIINIFGAKTMNVLLPLELDLEMEPTTKLAAQGDGPTKVGVRGFVSRPAHGEGRQTPDRQMFFVNGRPCGLPQFAKVFNEVYRAYNSSQSPFIVADIQLDTHLYDVNVSPDKRTILLHDQSRMLESLREALSTLFNSQDYALPTSRLSAPKQSSVDTLRSASISSAVSSAAKSKNESSLPPNGSSHSPSRNLRSSSDHSSSRKDKDQTENTSADESEDDDVSPPSKRRAPAKSPSRANPVGSLMTRWAASAPGHPDSSSLARESPMAKATTVSQKSNSPGRQKVNGGEPDISGQSPPVLTQESAGNIRPIDTHQPPVFNESRSPTQHVAWSSEGRLAASGLGKKLTSTGKIHNKPAATTIGRIARVSPPYKSTSSSRLSHPPPSFGGRLSQIFSANASKQAGSDTDLIRARTPDSEDERSGEEVDEEAGKDEMLRDTEEDVDNDSDMADASYGTGHQASMDVSGDGHSARQSPVAGLPGKNSTDADAEEEEEEEEGAEESPVIETNIPGDDDSMPSRGESSAAISRPDFTKRSHKKEATYPYVQHVRVDVDKIASLQEMLQTTTKEERSSASPSSNVNDDVDANDAEEKLSLTISKGDFGRMKIVGQFNLGFILAVRPAQNDGSAASTARQDELFIIDQHATDEKYNFERLQRSTVVQSQRLVHPKTLDLTALEEEVVIENLDALEKNGFKVTVDESGDSPVGERCKLLALPLSRETTFTLADLEELIALLQDHHQSTSDMAVVPRPSKVRKMFAMRACRSSIMIGKALAQKQMEKVVRHMEDLDKPWNCPHGRPTMRHLCSLKAWDEQQVWEGGSWDKGAGRRASVWSEYLRNEDEED